MLSCIYFTSDHEVLQNCIFVHNVFNAKHYHSRRGSRWESQNRFQNQFQAINFVNWVVPVRVKHRCLISAITVLDYNQPIKLKQIQNTQLNLVTVSFLTV